MTDLVDEIKAAFEYTKDAVSGESGVAIVRSTDEELAPGFRAMQTYYNERLLVIARRGYRHHAGSVLPTDGDELVERTTEVMTASLIAAAMGAFSDGVMLGHRSDHYVQMMFHFHTVDHLFHPGSFRDKTIAMAHGFAEDREVCEYFHVYLQSALHHMAHMCGVAHDEIKPAKIWDLWLLAGTAVITASYLAGMKMGASWRERDVLDGIEIASDESEGEDGSDH